MRKLHRFKTTPNAQICAFQSLSFSSLLELWRAALGAGGAMTLAALTEPTAITERVFVSGDITSEGNFCEHSRTREPEPAGIQVCVRNRVRDSREIFERDQIDATKYDPAYASEL